MHFYKIKWLTVMLFYDTAHRIFVKVVMIKSINQVESEPFVLSK